ncbi:MAG: HisA/HisF-related TIM barrel protein, partial [Ilumatobacteraceae bacterium]
VRIPVQLGGGIRDDASIERALGAGVSRVVVGTRAAAGDDFVARAVRRFGGEKIAEDLMAKIEPLTQTVPLEVATLLSEQEVVAITERAKWLFDGAQFPIDPSGRHYPWPLV